MDDYSPCSIAPDHGNTLVYNVTLPAGSKDDTLSVEMCSPGGYDQVRGLCSSTLTLPCICPHAVHGRVVSCRLSVILHTPQQRLDC